MQGHNNAVAGLSWAQDDSQLASVAGPACYFWRMPQGGRISELDHVDLSQVSICLSVLSGLTC